MKRLKKWNHEAVPVSDGVVRAVPDKDYRKIISVYRAACSASKLIGRQGLLKFEVKALDRLRKAVEASEK